MTILERRTETLKKALLQVPVHETRICILTQPGEEPEDAEVMLIGFPWSHEFLTGALVDLAERDTAAFDALVDWLRREWREDQRRRAEQLRAAFSGPALWKATV